MKPKYSAAITRCSTETCIDVYFSQPLAPETKKKLKELGNYEGITVLNSHIGEGVRILLKPVWDSNTVVEEIVTILVSEGFDRASILVK